MKNKYQPGIALTYKETEYHIVQDSIISDKATLDKSQFIFSTLVIEDRTLYFTVDSANHRTASNLNQLTIGFWHAIINNQADYFNFNEEFKYKIEIGDEILFIKHADGLINTGIIYKASFASEDTAIESYQELSIDADNYTHFSVIRTSQQKLNIKKKQQQTTAVKYAVVWLIVSAMVASYYFFKKMDFDNAELSKNALSSKVLGLKKTHQNIKNSTVTNENLALKHIENMLKFSQSYVGMNGELDLISNKNIFSFQSNTNIEVIKYISKEKDVAVKLDYDPLKAMTNVTWSVK